MKLMIYVLFTCLLFFTACVTDEEVSDPDHVEKETSDISKEKESPDEDEVVQVNDEDEVVQVNDEDEEIVEVDDEDDLEEVFDEDEEKFCSDFATVFPLQPGDCVPDFTIPAQDGVTMVTLSDYRGMYVLFSSFPLANTPVCTGQMQTLDSMYNDFISENIQPFGLNNESPDKKEGWCETMGIENLLILADHNPKDAVSTMFGIAGSMTARANTVIGPDGRFVMKKACANATCIPAILEDIKNLK